MKQKIVALCAFLTITTALFAAPTPRLRIIATTFPLYDWTRQILGQQLASMELVQLQDNGVDLHNFQPTVKDIARISQCDLFLFVGGESDEWVEKTLRTQRNPRRIALNLIKELGNSVLEEEHMDEGKEHERHKDGEHEHHKDGEDEHHHKSGEHDEHEADEHIWLSLRCAASLCEVIAARLSALDPEHATEYQANARIYIAKLQELDRRYKAVVDNAPLKTLVFADRFPFRYMAKDYGLTCHAAFSGCSAETEASFKTIAFLAKKVNEQKLPAVIVLEGRRHKIAESVTRASKRKDVKILMMNSLQSSTSKEAASGKGYLDTMEKNLEVLKRALGSK